MFIWYCSPEYHSSRWGANRPWLTGSGRRREGCDRGPRGGTGSTVRKIAWERQERICLVHTLDYRGVNSRPRPQGRMWAARKSEAERAGALGRQSADRKKAVGITGNSFQAGADKDSDTWHDGQGSAFAAAIFATCTRPRHSPPTLRHPSLPAASLVVRICLSPTGGTFSATKVYRLLKVSFHVSPTQLRVS